MTDTPLDNSLLLGYQYTSTTHAHAYLQKHTVTTLADSAITAVTPIFDVRPCSHITISTKVDNGHVDLYLRAILDEKLNADATWHTYLSRLTFSDDNVIDTAIRLDTHKLGISYLRLDAQKSVSNTVIVNTWYRGLIDHVSNTSYLTGGQNG